MIDSLSVLESLHHLLVQFRVRNLCADGNTSLDSFFNLSDQGKELDWGVDILCSHATLSGIQGWNFENSVRLLDMLNFNLTLKVNSCDWLWKSNNGLELTNSDRDTSALLWNLLVLWGHSVWHIEVLEHLPSFFGKSWENLHLGIGQVLLKEINADLTLLIIPHFCCILMQVNHMSSNSFVSTFLSDILHNEDAIESG